MTLPLVPTIIALALTYGFADRFAGGGLPALDARLPGRAAFWGAVLAAGVGYLLAGFPGMAFAGVWLAWRTPPWKIIPGASATPYGLAEVVATFARHAIPVLVGAFIVSKGLGVDMLPALATMGAFAFVSTALAAWYGDQTRYAARHGWGVADENAFLELARGAAYGAAVAVACGVG